MTNVVPLRPQLEPMVWRCNCGCVTFYALDDCSLQCAACDVIQSGPDGAWRKTFPSPDDAAPAPDTGDAHRRVIDFTDAKYALKRVLGRADPDKTAFVIVAQDDGHVSTWGGITATRKHRGWLNRRLAEAKKLLLEIST